MSSKESPTVARCDKNELYGKEKKKVIFTCGGHFRLCNSKNRNLSILQRRSPVHLSFSIVNNLNCLSIPSHIRFFPLTQTTMTTHTNIWSYRTVLYLLNMMQNRADRRSKPALYGGTAIMYARVSYAQRSREAVHRWAPFARACYKLHTHARTCV